MDPRMAYQALARPLSEIESEFARVLEGIFTAGHHEFSAVAKQLDILGTARPSGLKGPWNKEVLSEELSLINVSLDLAYANEGIGA